MEITKKATRIGEEDDGWVICGTIPHYKTIEAVYPVRKLGLLGFEKDEKEDCIVWHAGNFSLTSEQLKDAIILEGRKYVNLVDLLIGIYDAGIAEGKLMKSNELRKLVGLTLYGSEKTKTKQKLRKDRKK